MAVQVSPISSKTKHVGTKPLGQRKKRPRNPSKKSQAEAAQLNRKQKLDRTRVAILQSALEHFGRVGFDGASVRTIAADAKVNHGMIRHIYGSKKELWRHAITFLFERIDEELGQNAEELAGLSSRARHEAYIRRYVEYCARHPEHARIMIQQSIFMGPQLTWTAEQFISARHQRDLPFLEHLKKSGDLPNVDALALHFIIVGACQMIYLLAPEIRAVDGRDVFEKAAIRKHADAIVALLYR
jgi:AcrR family transcriptional regulator